LIIAARILGHHLSADIGGQATHHVVAGWNNRDGLLDRIRVGESTGELQDTRQAKVQRLFAQVIQLQVDVILVGTASATLKNFENHGARHHVTPRKVFGVGRIAFHETLAFAVNQVAALTTAALGNKGPGTMNTGGMELPHLHILDGNTCPQRHAHHHHQC